MFTALTDSRALHLAKSNEISLVLSSMNESWLIYGDLANYYQTILLALRSDELEIFKLLTPREKYTYPLYIALFKVQAEFTPQLPQAPIHPDNPNLTDITESVLHTVSFFLVSKPTLSPSKIRRVTHLLMQVIHEANDLIKYVP